MARETELDDVSMNLNPWGQAQAQAQAQARRGFGAGVEEEGEGVLVGVQETTSHGGVKCEGLRRRGV